MLWQFQLRSKNTFRTIESLRDCHCELDVIKNLHTLTAQRASDATRRVRLQCIYYNGSDLVLAGCVIV